ncbi:MAG: transposase [Clostridia bacterium]|nr:transposase [Clostridia bacterium]
MCVDVRIIKLGVGIMEQYSEEFKEQVLAEVDQVGSAALVARRYQISENTVYTWMAKRRQNGSVASLPKAKVKRLKELEERLKRVSTENERLKRLLAEKELELAILRELKERVNPR